MDKLRISDALFALLMNFSSEMGKNEVELRKLTDQFANRIYKDTHDEMLREIKNALIEEKNDCDRTFNTGYVLGSHHAFCIFRQKDFDPRRYQQGHHLDDE